jgi:hypothetical protein
MDVDVAPALIAIPIILPRRIEMSRPPLVPFLLLSLDFFSPSSSR